MKDNSLVTNEDVRIQRTWTSQEIASHIRSLPIWTHPIELKQLFGGLQNRTYFIRDADGHRYVARSGFDQGRITQTSVIACTIAAAKLGVGPAVRYVEPHLMITDFVEGPQLQAADQQDPRVLPKIIELLKTVHSGSEVLSSPISYWAPFATVRRYLADLETGFPDVGIPPSSWAPMVPFYKDVTYRLEPAIAPCHATFTHNDVGYANMMFRTQRMEAIWLIDWDGGGYGNPMWDIGELAMWADADEDLDRFLLAQYWGRISGSRTAELLHQHVAFKIMAALRLMAECAQAAIDPAYYLSPEEVAQSMDTNLPGQQKELAGLVELLRPRFDKLWHDHARCYY